MAGDDEAVGGLYDELYEQSVVRPSDRYERLTAAVLKTLNPEARILHHSTQKSETGRSEYVIDVVVENAASERTRLLIECREKRRALDRDAVLAHHAKAKDVGAEAVLVTTTGYQQGAIVYAEDSGVALIVLRRFEPGDWEGRVREVTMNVRYALPVGPKATLRLADEGSASRLADAGVSVPVEIDEAEVYLEEESFFDEAGDPTSRVMDVLGELGADLAPGSKELRLPEPQFMDWRGVRITVAGVHWQVMPVTIEQTITAGRDMTDAELVCEVVVGQQFNKAIFRRHLAGYAFDADGEVIERARLISPGASQ
jgi:hypothetical protein